MACIDPTVRQVERHIYTHDEITRYFRRIELPETRWVYDASKLDDKQKLEYLTLLQKHELCKVPWENLTQHYSVHKTISVRPRWLYRKIVDGPGRGGYCMEANYFFHLILVALKFDTYIVGSRIYHPDEKRYGGWTHCVNLVTIDSQVYLLDGGFGPQGPDRPLPMRDGDVETQISPAQMKVTYETLSQNLDRRQKSWIYSYRYNESSEWTPMYCFTDLEFFPEDIESMNFAPWLSKNSFFTHKVVCVRFTTDREVDAEGKPGSPDAEAMQGEIHGTMTLNSEVFKWRKNGKKVVELKLKNEKERLDALQKYFGIEFDLDDQESILGSAAQVGAMAMGTSEST